MEPDPYPFHKREKLGRYRTGRTDNSLCLFREVFHPEKQGLPCQGRRTWTEGLMLGWQQDNEQGWDHPSRDRETVKSRKEVVTNCHKSFSWQIKARINIMEQAGKSSFVICSSQKTTT